MKLSVTIASAIFLGFVANTTASATDWCTKDPLPSGTPIVCTRALRSNHSGSRPNDFIYAAWKDSDLPQKVWCKVSEDQAPEEFCKGYDDSQCGRYPYLVRNLMSPGPGLIGIQIENQDGKKYRYVVIYADKKPATTGYCIP